MTTNDVKQNNNQMTPIPYGRQHITQEDIDAVVDVLKSDYLTQGPKIAEFEKVFAEYIGCKYAVAVSNGTAALHLSALALGVKSGDKVITTPITFVASANCVLYCGGQIDFVDIDPDTYLMDLNKLEEKLKSAKRGTYKGIIPVDFAGYPVNLEKLKAIADKYNLWILEDACHAPGGYFVDSKGKKQYCGNGNFADLAIFSFHPVKHIACGEGGMITTNDEKLYKKLLLLRTHGITKDANSFRNTIDTATGILPMTTNDVRSTNDAQRANNGRRPNDPMTTNDAQRANDQMTAAGQMTNKYPSWYYEMQELGFNYRLTDFQAALGISQLKKANAGLKRRREIASVYQKAFSDNPHVVIQSGLQQGHAYHLFIIEIEKRKDLYDHLRKNNIFSQVHYIPVHLMPYYKQLGWKKGDLPVAEKYYERCLSLPMYPTLKDDEQNFVIQKITEFFKK